MGTGVMADEPSGQPMFLTTPNDTENATSRYSTTTSHDVVFPEIPQWISALYLILLCMTIGLGIPGNLITVLAYFFHKDKTNCDWYIFFVALLDLLSCAVCGTGYLIEFLERWNSLVSTHYCKFLFWLSQTTVCASIFIIGVIAVDRYAKLCDVTGLNFTVRMSRNICILVSALTSALASPNLFLAENLPRGICGIKSDLVSNRLVAAYYSVIFILFLVMMLAVVFCYANIIRKVRSSRKVLSFSEDTVNSRTSHALRMGRALGKERRKDPQTAATINQRAAQASGSTSVSSITASSDLRQTTFLSVPTTSQGQKSHNHIDAAHAMSIPWIGDGSGSRDGRGSGGNIAESRALGEHARVEKSPREPKVSREVVNLNHGNFVSMATEIQRSRRLRRDYKLTGLLFLVTFVFILSWVPPYIAMVKGVYIGYSEQFNVAETITLHYGKNVYIINNFSNPLIYVALSSVYRAKVKSLFTKVKDFCVRCRNRMA